MFGKNLKRMMSVVLSAVLIAQMMGVTAFAEEPVNSNEAAIEETGDGSLSPETPDQSASPQGEALEDGENIDESLPPLGEGAPEGRMREDDETVSEDDETVSEDDATVSEDSASVSSDAAPEIEAVEGDAPEVLGDSGTCGSKLKWDLSLISGSNNYKLTITGTGAMEDFPSYDAVPWNDDLGYKGKRISQIEIGAGVTSIGNYAFDGSFCGTNSSVTSLNVSLPEGLTTIGEYAFNGQTKLYNIFIPKSVYIVKPYAFQGCSNLNSICFWGSDTRDEELNIGRNAFSGCKNTMSITLPRYFELGGYSFSGVNKLNVYCPCDIHYHGGQEVNYGNEGANLSIKKLIDDTGGGKAANVYRGQAYGYIGDGSSGATGVYYTLSELTSANPARINIFGSGKMLSFSFNSRTNYPWYKYKNIIKGVVVNNKAGETNKVTSIGGCAFYEYEHLDNVYFWGDNRINIGYAAFYGCKNAEFNNLSSKTGSIGPFAFGKCEKITTVNLTESHTLEEANDSKKSGSNFTGCTGITTLTINMGSGKIIPRQAFNGCTGLTNGLTITSAGNIKTSAFLRCSKLNDPTITSVGDIDNEVFSGCAALTTLTIGKAGTINTNAFLGANNLESLTLTDVGTIDANAFYRADKLATLNIVKAGTIKTNAFSSCTALKTLTIGEAGTINANSMSAGAASGSLTISKASAVSAKAFENWTNLSSATLNNVSSVKGNAFKGCTGLRIFTIGNGTKCESGALNECTNLTTFNINGESTSFTVPITDKPDNLVNLTVAAENTNYKVPLNSYCITNKDGKTLILGTKKTEIPESVESIGDSAFQKLNTLTSITIPTNVTSIGANAFKDSGVKRILYPGSEQEWDSKLSAHIGTGNNPPIDADKTRIVFAKEEGDFGEGLRWVISNVEGGKKLTITQASGSSTVIPVFDPQTVPWAASAPYITQVDADFITSVGDYAFSGFKKLATLNLGNLTAVGAHAFEDCDALAAMPNGNYEAVGDYAFAGCDALTSVKSGVTQIRDHAFENCAGLTSFTNTNATIGDYAFAGSGLTAVPSRYLDIGAHAFEGCSGITGKVEIETAGIIGEAAFKDCTGLTEVELMGDVTSINENVFEGCEKLTKITFPGAAEYIGEGVVKGCNALEHIYVSEGDRYKGNDDNNILFFEDPYSYKIIAVCPGVTTLDLSSINITEVGKGAFAGGSFTSIKLPDSVTTIGAGAFEDCVNLTSFELPKGVTDIGGGLFSGCTSLETVTVNAGNTTFRAENNSIIKKETDTLVATIVAGSNATAEIPANVKAIGEGAFKGCFGLSGEYAIPSGVTEIGDYAFYGCIGITEMDIPATVTSIGEGAFGKCSGISEGMTIPEGVTEIKKYTFTDCASLKSIGLPSSLTTIGDQAFLNCASLTGEIDLSKVGKVGESAFEGCGGITSVLLPATEDSDIGSAVFKDCIGLTSIAFPANLKCIPEKAFAGCTGITELTIGQSVETIEESAFEGAGGLTEVLIPKSVTSIMENAFNGTSVNKVDYTGKEDEWTALTANIESGNDVLLSAEKEYEFLSKVKPTKLTISPSSKTAHLGDDPIKLKLTYTPDNIYPESYKAVKWSSSVPGVASVDNEGTVTVKTIGETVITVETTDPAITPAVKGECMFTVKDTEYKVTFEPGFEGSGVYSDSVLVEKGKSIDLDPEKFVRDGFTLTGWKDEENKTYKSDEKGISINKDKTFTAQWKDNGGKKEEEKTTVSESRVFTGKNAEGQEVQITMTVEITKSVSYNGGKHVWEKNKAGKSSLNDVKVEIGGTILDYIDASKTKVTIKNNKDVSVGGSGKAPKVTIKLKQKDKKCKKTVSSINKKLKKEVFSFDINPLDLNTVKDTIEAKANKSKTKITKLTCTVPFGSRTKKLKLKKKDYKATLDAAAGTAVIEGQKNYTGTVTVGVK